MTGEGVIPAKFGIGQPIRRIEDRRLITGHGRFADDVNQEGALQACFLRSPHAHAAIRGIDTSIAASLPGVRAIYTGADLARLGVKPLPHAMLPLLKAPNGQVPAPPPRHALAPECVRYVGEAVAMVVAESRLQAMDAVEAIGIEYEPLKAEMEAEGDVVAIYRSGDRAAAERAFAAAAHIVEARLVNNRLVANPLEPRAAIASLDEHNRLVLKLGCQGSSIFRVHLAQTLDIPKDQIAIKVGDIGGGFGIKMWLYPEYVAIAAAARDLRLPVHWRAERSESFLADTHGRDQKSEAALALDRQGRFLALRIRTNANIGAYLSYLGAMVPTIAGTRVATGAYDIPVLDLEVRCCATNTMPVDAYRGAGRPESIYVIERLVDLAARRCGFDRIALRERNFIPAQAMPYRNAAGVIYDSGDFAGVMRRAMEKADWNGFAARRSVSQAAGRKRGLGLSYFIESTGAANPTETVDIQIDKQGVRVLSGTQAMGQGIATGYAQLLAGRLGISIERIEIVQGDTDLIPMGGGSAGSRSMFIGGSVLVQAAEETLRRAREQAARHFETGLPDIEYEAGSFRVAGTDRRIDLFALAALQPDGRLGAVVKDSVADMSWPNGCHIAEVEIDPETGTISVERFTAIDDVGTVINPLLVHGQAHGGIAQGIGQALFENCVFDPENGQLLTASFLDYGMPRADNLPSFQVETDERSPCRNNLLGAKGAGECGAIGAPPAIVSAICDALDIDHIDMPVTAEKIWRRLQEGLAR